MRHLVLWYPKHHPKPGEGLPLSCTGFCPLNQAVKVFCTIVQVLVGNIHLKMYRPYIHTVRSHSMLKRSCQDSKLIHLHGLHCFSKTLATNVHDNHNIPACAPLFTVVSCPWKPLNVPRRTREAFGTVSSPNTDDSRILGRSPPSWMSASWKNSMQCNM